jgi:NAD(P)-dependent dehydrogenase (short-subunit alcohol dehydrogenase family)
VNGSIIPVTCDITSKESLQTAVASIQDQTPFVNAVVANSGTTGPITAIPPRAANATVTAIQEQLWNTSHEESRNVMDVNVVGSFYTFVAFMKLLEAGNTHPDSRATREFIQSQFITITSLASFSRQENVGHAYMASKAGLVHLTKSLATGFGPRGIRANSIAPGLYITEMTEEVQGFERALCISANGCSSSPTAQT